MSVFELFISAIFVNNIVLAQYLGNCPYLGCSRDKGVAVGMGSAVIFVIFMATLCIMTCRVVHLNFFLSSRLHSINAASEK